MGIEAKVLLDSINPSGDRITTFILKFPRFILPEFNTHRALSRNASSSRAIPIEKIIATVLQDPAMPEFWGKNQKGMQAYEELDLESKERAKRTWLRAGKTATKYARILSKIGLHKQLANRIIEPWVPITVLATATDYENFTALRYHGDAQPEIGVLAHRLLDAYNESIPKLLQPGELHIPFAPESSGLTSEQRMKIAVARAARVSYLNFEGKMEPEKDYALHDDLESSGHWSPFEHTARAMSEDERQNRFYLMFDGEKIPGICGNLKGWVQYRKQFKTENRSDSRVLKKA